MAETDITNDVDEMDDLDRYIAERKARDPAFAKALEEDLSDFILSSELVSLREFMQMTQEDVAKKNAHNKKCSLPMGKTRRRHPYFYAAKNG